VIAAALDGLSERRGACLMMVGEPGIGKSRLVSEAIAEAQRRGAWVLSGRASPIGGAVPYESLTAALLHGLRSRPLPQAPDRDALRAGLATLLPGFVDGPAVGQSPVLLGETVLRLARLAGGVRGTLIVLDDLHWACGDTLAVAEYLADNAAHEPVVVLATLRPEGAALALADALERRRSAQVLTLERLDKQAVGEMTAASLSDPDCEPPEALIDLLCTRAEGLPFLVEELLSGLIDRGMLATGEGGWELADDLPVEVPLSFSQMVRERLAELSAEARRILETGAVLGRDFDWTALPGLVGTDEAEVLKALSSAIELHLVEETGGDRFRFRHGLTVEAILEQMLASQHSRLAGRTLDALVDGAEPGGGRLELLAHLAVQAGRDAEAAGYLIEEARRALSAGALATAIADARRASRLASSGQPESLLAREVLLFALGQSGDADAVEAVGGALVAELDTGGASADRRAAVRLVLARSAYAALERRRARTLCVDALELHPRETHLTVALQLLLAEIALSEDKFDEAFTGAHQALAVADGAGFDELACDALLLLGRYRLLVTFELRRAEECFRDALRRAERAGLPLYRLRVMHQMAWLDLGGSADPIRIEEARGLAEELGALALVAELEQVLAMSHLLSDRLDAAARCAERALESAHRYRLGELAGIVSGIQAAIEATRGQRAQAEHEGTAPRRRDPVPARGPGHVLRLERGGAGGDGGRRAARGARLDPDGRRIPARELLRSARDRRGEGRPRSRCRGPVRRRRRCAGQLALVPGALPPPCGGGRAGRRVGRAGGVARGGGAFLRDRGQPVARTRVPIAAAARRDLSAKAPGRARRRDRADHPRGGRAGAARLRAHEQGHRRPAVPLPAHGREARRADPGQDRPVEPHRAGRRRCTPVGPTNLSPYVLRSRAGG